MVDALPDMEDITDENRTDVISQLEAIDNRKWKLSDEARGVLDFEKYEDAAFVLSAPEGFFGFVLGKVYTADAAEMPQADFAFLDAAGEPETVVTAEGTAVASVSPVPNGEEVRGYLPVGEYTLEETVEGSWNLTLTVNGETDSDLTFTGESGRGYMLAAGNYVTYPIHLEPSEHGSVAVTGDEVFPGGEEIQVGVGSVVTLTLTPDTGYLLDSLTVTQEGGGEYTLTEVEKNVYTFTMLAYDTTVTASFTACSSHYFNNGACLYCGEPCDHSYTNGRCENCYYSCPHEELDACGFCTCDMRKIYAIAKTWKTCKTEYYVDDGGSDRRVQPELTAIAGEERVYTLMVSEAATKLTFFYLPNSSKNTNTTKELVLPGKELNCYYVGKHLENYIYDGTWGVYPCVHDYTDKTGVCGICGEACAHGGWSKDFVCGICGYTCVHSSSDPETQLCKVCGKECEHTNFDGGKCQSCQYSCPHAELDENGFCTVCDMREIYIIAKAWATCSADSDYDYYVAEALGDGVFRIMLPKTVADVSFYYWSDYGDFSTTVDLQLPAPGLNACYVGGPLEPGQGPEGTEFYIFDSHWGVYPCPHTWENGVCGECGEVRAHGTEKEKNKATCAKIAVCDTCGLSYGEVDKTNHDEIVSFDDNGFCPNGCYEPAVLNNSVYEISNVGQYCWFAQQVGSGNNYIGGKLLADIDISGDRFAGDAGVMIGNVNHNFSGIFDGNGHTLTVKLSAQSNCVGPFLFIHGATIRNLTVNGTVTTSAYFAGGLVASTYGDCVIENCVSDVTIISTKVGDGTHGGLVGYCQGGTLKVNNCAFRGKIDGPSTTCCGGMVGWAGGVVIVKNCYVAGTFVMDDTTGSDTFARNAVNLAFENCYYLNEFGATNIGPVQKSAAQFASGEVAYLLSQGENGDVWGQTIGTETYPVPGGETVYQVKDCDGESIAYSNKNENKGHTPENCVCAVCGAKAHQETFGYDENGFCHNGCCEPAELNNGVYEIGNAGQLYWFMQQVNSGNKGINAVLTADIDMVGYPWVPITQTGLYYGVTTYPDSGYTGTFDGQGHVISNLTVSASSIADASYGLFGTLSGAVKNLGIHFFAFEGAGMDSRVGAVAGQMLDGSLVENCYVIDININTRVNTENGVAGGIAGCNYAGTVRNCFTDNVSITAARYGGILGDNRGDISETDRLGTMDNCYTSHIYLRDPTMLGNAPSGEAGVTAAWFASGEVAYLLSQGKNGGIWGQSIGTEDSPVLNGAAVYKVKDCIGTEIYSNKNEDQGHILVNCICSVCKKTIHDETVNYENGFCPNGCYEPAVLNGDVYEISNAGQLYWFSQQVNYGNTAINGKLMENIVVNEGTMTAESTGIRAWTPIGIDRAWYRGMFDGNNKSISGLYFYDTDGFFVGLFGLVDTDGKIQNVGVVNLYFHGDNGVGGVVGISLGTVADCYSTGTVSGGDYVGGVVGSNEQGTVTNCYFSGDAYTGTAIGSNSGTATNVEGKTTAQFASGEVAYLLSQGENSSVWGQTIPGQSAPVLGGKTVYYGYTSCSDTEMKYTNTSTASQTKPDHTFATTLSYDANNHWYASACGHDVTSGLEAHHGGTATCENKAVCADCGQSYGEKNPGNHTGELDWAQTPATHKRIYVCCGAIEVNEVSHDWGEDNVCTTCHYGCAHNYENPAFEWQADNSSAKATVTCGNYGDVKEMNCEINSQWDAEMDTLTFTATADNGTYTDTQTIQLAVVGGKLTITNSAAETGETVNMIIIVAGYTSGRMTDCQEIEDVTGVTEINLTVTGETIKVFFLKPGTYAPLFACAEQ